ncbi:ROK family protein [Rhizobium lemnae]|uniref:ROK family protein n=1 Tax=Rhizobium lemnae TaxID=1214924 RepID=A0ABV8EBW1_9HYPH|nr:ROK family transcriptional regulator [Rhizobium lemnae]MCJ8510429.1 ROK family protein [Rhizobium lemnae]
MANMISDDLRGLLSERHVDSPVARVVRALSGHGAVSAAQIARTTGLARSTVSTILSDLKRSSLVVEVETRSPGVGRPAIAHSLNPEAGTCLGVLLGRNEARVVLADVAHNVIADVAIPLERDYRPEKATRVIKQTIDNIYKEHSLPFSGLLGVGFAVSGAIAANGRILRGASIPGWSGVDLRATFEPALQKPIFADKESNCAALAEMMWGAAVGVEDFVLFKHDVTIGGAIVANGRVLSGYAGTAGEVGHIMLNPHGDLCSCGNRGCLELECGGSQMISVAERRGGRSLTLPILVQEALAGDIGLRRLIEDAGDVAGRGLATVGTLFNPRMIVISGALAAADDILLAPMRASYGKYTLVKSGDVDGDLPTFVVGKFLDNDNCLGAVGLVLRHHGRLI